MGDNPGLLIAIDLTFLYLTMGPLVLLGVYVLCDYFIRDDSADQAMGGKIIHAMDQDPAFWTEKDVWLNF